MHVLLIHQAFATIQEPGGTRHHELALYLADCGHRITIIASPISYLTGRKIDSDSKYSEHEQIRIIRPWVYSALHRSFLHRVLNFLSFMISSFIAGLGVEDVDLVWGTTPPLFQGVTAWVLARIKRAPFLFEVRDLWPAFAVAVGVLNNRLLINVSEWLERFLYRGANALVINSPGFRKHVESKGGRRVFLVPNGADVTMFHPENRGNSFRKENDLDDQFVVLYAGAHGMSNDLDVLLETANLLRALENVNFVLLGDGKEKPRLQQQAVLMDLNNVRFIDPLPKAKMTEAISAADVCVAILKPVDLYKTVYPNKVFDYMAAGRPVILAIDGVIREVVESACAGVAVQPGNPDALAEAIRVLEADPIKRKMMGQNGRRHIEKYFERSKLAEKLITIMNGMINS